MDFAGMADYVGTIVGKVAAMGLPKGMFLNLNGPCIPVKETQGVRITRQADNNLSTKFDRREDPRGKSYFWYGNMLPVRPEDDTDNDALLANYISITPIQCDMTAYTVMAELQHAGF